MANALHVREGTTWRELAESLTSASADLTEMIGKWAKDELDEPIRLPLRTFDPSLDLGRSAQIIPFRPRGFVSLESSAA